VRQSHIARPAESRKIGSTWDRAAGIDVLLLRRRSRPTGKAYGLDMTDEMLAWRKRSTSMPPPDPRSSTIFSWIQPGEQWICRTEIASTAVSGSWRSRRAIGGCW